MSYVVAAALLIFVATLPSAATTAAAFDWNLANGFGYVACLLFVLLCVFGARGAPQGAGYRWHRDVGIAALLVTTLHVLILLFDPAVWLYLAPGAPSYMWAGLLACPPLLVLTLGALRWARRRWPADPALFRTAHLVWTWALLLFAAWHVVGAGAYIPSPVAKSVALAALLGLPLAAQLAGKRFKPTRRALPRPQFVFGSAGLLLLCFVMVRSA